MAIISLAIPVTSIIVIVLTNEVALTLNTCAYSSEIIRGGIQSVSFGQIESAKSTGMSGLLLYRRIILPIAFRQALPAYGNEMILMVKASIAHQ